MFSHLNEEGRGRMVDIGGKKDTERYAKAHGYVFMSAKILKAVEKGEIKKGDVLAVAQIAGIMAAKRTPYEIPLCHPLMITHADIKFRIIKEYPCIEIISEVKTTGKTGAEMEALNAVSTAALTIYDMCKGLEKGIVIGDISLLEKSGGKSGLWKPEFVKEGKVINIAVGSKKGEEKKPVEECEIIENFGLKGDAHAGGSKKQVSIFAMESIKDVPENKMIEVMKGGYTENLTIVGIPLYYLVPYNILRVGTVEIEIESVGKESFVNGGRPYIVSRKGIFGHVKKTGIVKVGDTIGVIN